LYVDLIFPAGLINDDAHSQVTSIAKAAKHPSQQCINVYFKINAYTLILYSFALELPIHRLHFIPEIIPSQKAVNIHIALQRVYTRCIYFFSPFSFTFYSQCLHTLFRIQTLKDIDAETLTL
jgi:hypothetical protein